MMFSKSCPVKHSSSIASRFHRQYGHANLEHSSMCSIEGSTGSKDAVDSNEWEYDVDIPSASQPTTLPIKIPLPSRSASSRRNEMQEIEEMTEMYDERTWQMYYRLVNNSFLEHLRFIRFIQKVFIMPFFVLTIFIIITGYQMQERRELGFDKKVNSVVGWLRTEQQTCQRCYIIIKWKVLCLSHNLCRSCIILNICEVERTW